MESIYDLIWMISCHGNHIFVSTVKDEQLLQKIIKIIQELFLINIHVY